MKGRGGFSFTISKPTWHKASTSERRKMVVKEVRCQEKAERTTKAVSSALCSTPHILTGCTTSLTQGQYTWRHNQTRAWQQCLRARRKPSTLCLQKQHLQSRNQHSSGKDRPSSPGVPTSSIVIDRSILEAVQVDRDMTSPTRRRSYLISLTSKIFGQHPPQQRRKHLLSTPPTTRQRICSTEAGQLTMKSQPPP